MAAWAGQTKKRLLDAEAKRRGDKPLVSGLATESLNRIFDFVHARRLKMMDLFALMDRDGSQVVDAHELHAALCSLGLQLRQQELMAVVEAMDVDGASLPKGDGGFVFLGWSCATSDFQE